MNSEKINNDSKYPSMEYRFMDYYSEEAKQTILPNSNSYNFLLERNKNHMNETAITFAGKTITYEELHTRIDEYAKALYKKGISSRSYVLI